MCACLSTCRVRHPCSSSTDGSADTRRDQDKNSDAAATSELEADRLKDFFEK